MEIDQSKDFGEKPSLCWLPVDRFIVDELYQRKIDSPRSRKLIAKISENFRWKDFGAVAASPRDGGLYAILDGQHRIEAAKWLQIPLVPSVLLPAMPVEAEAHSFVSQNVNRVPVNVFTMHRANLTRGDARASRIEQFVVEASLVIPAHQPNRKTIHPGEVVCINVLGSLIDRYDPAIAASALQALAAAYRDEIYGIRAPFLLVAAKMLEDGEVDQSALVAAFRQSTAAELYAQSGPPGKRNVAPARIERIVEILRERMGKSRPKWASENPVPQAPNQFEEVAQPEPDNGPSHEDNAMAPVTDTAGAEPPVTTPPPRGPTVPSPEMGLAPEGETVPGVVSLPETIAHQPQPARPQFTRVPIPIIDRPQFKTDGGHETQRDDWSIKPPTEKQRMGRR